MLEILNWSTNHLERHRIENPRLNAELLLALSLKVRREWLYVHLHDQVNEKAQKTFEGLIKRRIAGEPLQYLLGRQEFWSIGFKVNPHVLIPRPETEFLVEQALFILAEMPIERTPAVLEIGTGSGAVAISLAKEMRNIFLVATDISRDALLVAQENAKSGGLLGQIAWVMGNLFDPFSLFREKELFDLILSNPPYVDHLEIQRLSKEVRDYEPIIALDGGKDGLEVCQSITAQAQFYLRSGGWLLLEIGQGQALKVVELIDKENHFLKPEIVPDLSGIERVVKAQRK